MIINPKLISLDKSHAVDYTGYTQANAMPITFSPGRLEAEIEVPITNDRLVEGTERFMGQIISGGCIAGLDIFAPTATVDITDNDSMFSYLIFFNFLTKNDYNFADNA